MKRLVVAALVLSAACSSRSPVTTPTAPTPLHTPPEDYPITTIPEPPTFPPTAEDVKHYVGQTVLRLLQAGLRSNQVTPTDVAALAFCSVDPLWTSLAADDHWYLVKIDDAVQPWPGPLTPDPDAGYSCFQTPKAFTFPVGNHTLTVALVYPSSVVVPVPGTLPTTCVVGQDCYGAPSEPIAIVSALPPSGVLTGPPPSAQKGQVIR